MLSSIADRLPSRLQLGTFAALALSLLLISRRAARKLDRPRKIPKQEERVVIIGASSGIGREIAHEYAIRGARVCVVARREEELRRVLEECQVLYVEAGFGDTGRVFSVATDFTNVEQMVQLRERLKLEWDGVDTVFVCAGASALRPLMEVAGLDRLANGFNPPEAGVIGIQHTVDVASTAAKVNYLGPLISAAAFLPLLQSSSIAPSIALISSLGAVIPAPTRSLYCSTKAASLMLYQALSIEHPAVAFSLIIPTTVRGSFRSSAVDAGVVREVDPNKVGLRPEAVAKRSVRAVDAGEKHVFMPYVFGRFGHLLYWLAPSFVEWRARAKYNFAS
ncbi:NAD(P)-binding protein, partial [Laetiporus sulphureus 93-53]